MLIIVKNQVNSQKIQSSNHYFLLEIRDFESVECAKNKFYIINFDIAQNDKLIL